MPGERPRHIPQRSCVVCRQTQAKRKLIRLVRTTEGAVHVDERGRAPGRGAYLCRNVACWARALAEGSLARALRTGITKQDRATLEAHIHGLGKVMATATVAEDKRS